MKLASQCPGFYVHTSKEAKRAALGSFRMLNKAWSHTSSCPHYCFWCGGALNNLQLCGQLHFQYFSVRWLPTQELFAGSVETALFAWGIADSQQLSASAGFGAWASRGGTGTLLAPKPLFLPSPRSLLEKLQQLPPFPSSPQLLLPGASSPPGSRFLCRARVPHRCLFPGRAGAAPSLSLFPAMGLCIHALPSPTSSSLACLQLLLLSANCALLAQGLLLPALVSPPMLLPMFLLSFFVSGHLCCVTPACKPRATVEK